MQKSARIAEISTKVTEGYFLCSPCIPEKQKYAVKIVNGKQMLLLYSLDSRFAVWQSTCLSNVSFVFLLF